VGLFLVGIAVSAAVVRNNKKRLEAEKAEQAT
jgi:hypothetical protein